MRKHAIIGAVFGLVLSLSAVSQPSAGMRDDPNVFNGSATCAGSNCHGGTAPAANADILHNEYTTWSDSSSAKHVNAYRVLDSAVARQIARNMGVGEPQSAELCLSCHAMNVPEQQRGENFNIAEGVGCEACHGGSGQWLDKHQDLDVSLAELRAMGLFPTADPVKRAEMCLDCHFGATDQWAGHKLLASGHPRVSFELDSYTNLNAHHEVDADYKERKAHVPGGQTWAIGQAMAIERRMDLLISPRTGTIGFFPEFAFFDCHSCHQPMSVKRKASANRRGQPAFDDAHIQMLRIAMSYAEDGMADRVNSDLRALHRAAGQNRQALVQAAAAMRDTARAAVQSIASRPYSGDDLRGILRTLSAMGASGKITQYAAAEQTMLALDSTLFALYDGGYMGEAEFDRLYDALGPVTETVQSDDRYSESRFRNAMQAFMGAVQTPSN